MVKQNKAPQNFHVFSSLILLCKVAGSMRWMLWVTRVQMHKGLIFPRDCASLGGKHTMLSCKKQKCKFNFCKERN